MRASSPNHGANAKADLPGEVVLVLQGGGALGSYQAGVYNALHEAGIEPDWIIDMQTRRAERRCRAATRALAADGSRVGGA